MTAINEGVIEFVKLVKDGTLHPDALKAAALVGKDSELALTILKKEGFKI